jgi:hypothetical protein
MQDNKLIAEFMGVPQGKHTHFMVEPFALESYADVDDLKYDASWDWLMPVLSKILDLSFQDDGDAEDFYSIRDCVPDINHTYKAVVEFIKTYNDEQ